LINAASKYSLAFYRSFSSRIYSKKQRSSTA
jgi:hypothetical protein